MGQMHQAAHQPPHEVLTRDHTSRIVSILPDTANRHVPPLPHSPHLPLAKRPDRFIIAYRVTNPGDNKETTMTTRPASIEKNGRQITFWVLTLVLATLLAIIQNNVIATAATTTPADKAITGTIIETMDAAGYTYMNIDTGNGPVWVAIPETAVKQGEKVSCLPGMEMRQFHSKSFNRTFDSIIFSGGIEGNRPASPHRRAAAIKKAPDTDSFDAAVQAEKQAAASPSRQPNPSGGSQAAIAPYAEISVTKAAGKNSYTVEEIFSNAKELDGKTVRIRGKVVKYNANIMGRHWLHIQDGTGDPMQNTHDLVVTTTSKIENPDILTLEGTVAANRDFGAGYTYVVIIENSTIVE